MTRDRGGRTEFPRKRRRSASLGLMCILVPVLAGCTHALKEPPPLSGLAKEAGHHTAGEVDALLARASSLFGRREIDSAHQAAELWLQAAAADGSRTDGLVGASRALVWLTEHEREAKGREEAATRAVQAEQWCVRIAPESAVCQYWLGAALGVQARARPSTGLSALPEIEAAFKKARDADPTIEQGGPDRALALLYLRAPGWPTGPGDPDLGLDHAKQALAVDSDYPPNHLALGEALAAIGDTPGSSAAYAKALDLSRARATSGDPDAREWAKEAEEALEKLSRNRPK